MQKSATAYCFPAEQILAKLINLYTRLVPTLSVYVVARLCHFLSRSRIEVMVEAIGNWIYAPMKDTPINPNII